MSADPALKTLHDALKKGRFDGAYYICGEDEFRKEDATKRLSAAAIEPAALKKCLERHCGSGRREGSITPNRDRGRLAPRG